MINQQLSLIAKLLVVIRRPKCLLIIGSSKAGKTVLVKHFEGIILNASQNQQNIYLHNQNNEQLRGNSLEYGIQLEFAWHITSNDQLLVLEIPDIFNFDLGNQIASEHKARNFIMGLYLWCSALQISSEIAINIVIPFEYSINHSPLIRFFECWQSLLTTDQQNYQKVKLAIAITLTKLEYIQDSQQFHTIFKGLCDESQQNISQNPSFYPAADQPFTFLKQTTVDSQGPQMLDEILKKIVFQPASIFFKQSHIFLIFNYFEDRYSRQQLQPLQKQYINGLSGCLLQVVQMVGKILMIIYSKKHPNLQSLSAISILKQLELVCKNQLYLEDNQIQADIQSLLNNVNLLQTDFQSLANTVLEYYQLINTPNFSDTLLGDYCQQIYEIICQSQIAIKLQKQSKLFKKVSIFLLAKIQQLNLFMLIDGKAITQQAEDVYFKLLKNALIEGTKKWKLFKIIKNGDKQFVNYQKYLDIYKIFGQPEKQPNNSQQQSSEGQFIQKIQRIYSKNTMKQRINMFLMNQQQPKPTKSESVAQISKLVVKIDKEADNQKYIEQLLKKLEQYKQYRFYIEIKVGTFHELPEETLLRNYLEQVKGSVQKNKYDCLIEKIIPLALNKTILQQNFKISSHGSRILRRCMDFIAMENDISQADFQASEMIFRNLPEAQKFVYNQKDRPQQKKNTSKYELDKEVKKNIKINMDVKMKLVNKLKQKISDILKHLLIETKTA